MAKKNAREEPPKPTVAENAQMSDIVFILDKMELLLKAVSEIGQDGKFKTVDADKRHRLRELHQKFLEPVQGPDPFRHPLRQGGQSGLSGSAAGHRRYGKRKKDRGRGGIPEKV